MPNTSSSSSLESTLKVQENDFIYNNTSCYVVLGIHGKGCFGKVAKCFSLDTAEMVAIKILKEDNKTISQEMKMLKAISVLDSDKKNVVKFINSFKYNDLVCMVFEMLDQSLFDLMTEREWSPLSLNEIRPMVHQLLVSLEALKNLGIIHADLKLDNLMLVNHEDQLFKIKLIDFGQAISTCDVKVGMEMQNPLFRAPEVMLGLPLTEAVDMWSIGCLMLVFFLGDSPFPFDDEYGWMKNLVDLLGQPADHLLAAGRYTKYFFLSDKSGWRLLTREEFKRMHCIEPESNELQYHTFKKKYEKERKTSDEQDGLEHKDKMAFFDLLQCCLQLDPKERISPSKALKHPFITMVQLVDEMETSSYADTALEFMIASPLDNLDESPVNIVTNMGSTSISSSTRAAAAITPLDDKADKETGFICTSTGAQCAITPADADVVNTCCDKPFMEKHFQRYKRFFRRLAKRVVNLSEN